MTTKLTARSLKLTAVLDPTVVAGIPAPNGQPRVPVAIVCGGRVIRAELNAKSLRKVQAVIAEHGADGVAVVLQGKLLAGDAIAEAGITAQIKTPKPEATEA